MKKSKRTRCKRGLSDLDSFGTSLIGSSKHIAHRFLLTVLTITAVVALVDYNCEQVYTRVVDGRFGVVEMYLAHPR